MMEVEIMAQPAIPEVPTVPGAQKLKRVTLMAVSTRDEVYELLKARGQASDR